MNTRGGEVLSEDLTGVETDWRTLKDLHKELLTLCEENRAVGVAANQLGMRENFFFLMPGAKIPTARGPHTAHICVNPVWTLSKGAKPHTAAEGCLSLPGRTFLVERPNQIEAEWTNMLGHRVQKRLKGWAARVFMHEHDHLKGVTLLTVGKEITREEEGTF